MGVCVVCKELKSNEQLEKHHIVSRKIVTSIKKCELNLIDAYVECYTRISRDSMT